MLCYAGAERFKPNADMDRVAELEMLQEYLKDSIAKLDSQIQGKVAPLERMKRLLTSKDKKATLLEMAGGHTRYLTRKHSMGPICPFAWCELYRRALFGQNSA